jgi:hypothetical protein
VKDALREYGRTVAIFAAAGLVLSLLVGLLAGNPFGVMVLRAVLFAVLFGGIGAGMQYVVRRFLPEIAGGKHDEQQGADGAESKPEGSTIDIVLPEEPVPVGKPAEGRDELLEELPGTSEGTSAVEELDGAEPADEAAPSPASARVAADGARVGGRRELDALPDIGAMGDEAAPGGTRAGTRFTDAPARPARARAKPSDAARDVLEREDPATLARAVRTVLKREERS